MRRCVKIKIIGKVQGMGFRQFVKKHAQKLLLEGSIQNDDDGTVLAFVSGASEKLDDLIDFLYQGPPKSQVEDVVVEPLAKQRDYRGVFRIIGEK